MVFISNFSSKGNCDMLSCLFCAYGSCNRIKEYFSGGALALELGNM